VAVLADQARAASLSLLWLQSREELVETHAAFKALGFRLCGRTCHPDYDRVTSLTFQLSL
jgi:hypothetical protein